MTRCRVQACPRIAANIARLAAERGFTVAAVEKRAGMRPAFLPPVLPPLRPLEPLHARCILGSVQGGTEPMAGPTFTLDSNRRTVTVSFPPTLPPEMKLGVAQVEEILCKLGEFRALMTPAVPPGSQFGQKLRALSNPRWATEPETMTGDSLLHLRDPRFGWLHFVFSREMARKLGRLLMAQADAPLPRPAPDKIN